MPTAWGVTSTDLRKSKAEARRQHVKLLLQLGWLPAGPNHWESPKKNATIGKGFTYETSTAIALLKLRGELKRKGHCWALGRI